MSAYVLPILLFANLAQIPVWAEEPTYASTSLPEITRIATSVGSLNGFPELSVIVSIKTHMNLTKRIRITYGVNTPASILEKPCEGSIILESYDATTIATLSEAGSPITGSPTTGDRVETDYVFKVKLQEGIHQEQRPFCRGKYSLGSFVLQDTAQHYVSTSWMYESVGNWKAGFRQDSNVWDAFPSSAPCPRFPGYPSDAVRSACTVPENVLSSNFQLSESDWLNAKIEDKQSQEKALADQAVADEKWLSECRSVQTMPIIDVIKMVQNKDKPGNKWTKKELADFNHALKAFSINCSDLSSEFWLENSSEIKAELLKASKILVNLYQRYLKSIPLTITCYKSGLFKKVSGVKPVCPKGYKLVKP